MPSDRLRPLYAEFFRNVRRQPDPPLVTVANGPAHAAPASNGVGRRMSNGGAVSLSFVLCVSDYAILKADLQKSPCVSPVRGRRRSRTRTG
jgi:hypothetical protein